MKIFAKYPAPWRIERNHDVCPNGSNLHAIVDAKNEVVASSYSDSFDIIWAMYNQLSDLQKERLGNDKPGRKKLFFSEQPGEYFVLEDTYREAKPGDLFKRLEKHPGLVTMAKNPEVEFHVDELAFIHWRKPTSREIYEILGKTEE